MDVKGGGETRTTNSIMFVLNAWLLIQNIPQGPSYQGAGPVWKRNAGGFVLAGSEQDSKVHSFFVF